MDIRTAPLGSGLTVAEINSGAKEAWHFLPFEDREAELVALDERFVLAIGQIGSLSTSVAIFDTVERRRTNGETNRQLDVVARPRENYTWCYSPTLRSVFLVERAEGRGSILGSPGQWVRQLSVDGEVNRQLLIAPGFFAGALLPREDGRIVCVCMRTSKLAVLDPESGAVQMNANELLDSSYHPEFKRRLRWFSPDGRWGLRTHPTLIVHDARPHMKGRFRPFLSRFFPGAGVGIEKGDTHPDLEGKFLAYGRALDLFRLDPLTLERRLIIRYDDLDADALPAVERLCDQQGTNEWSARDKWLAGLPDDSPESIWASRLYNWIWDIRWDDDGQGFTVYSIHANRQVNSDFYRFPTKKTVVDVALRHVSLDGTVGPITIVPDALNVSTPLPSEKAIESIKALVRERSRQVLTCHGWTGSNVRETLQELGSRIDQHGLRALVFGGQLQLRFRIDKRVIGEKSYFETVRNLPDTDLQIMLPALRELLKCYGAAARTLSESHPGAIASGPSEHSPSALAEAALTLAMIDDTGFDALRDWILAVDQEHDYFAANKVFPAMARRTKFATPEALRFGLWFFLQQWQTVKYEKGWLGLFKAARSVMTPVEFVSAVVEEARTVSTLSDTTTIEIGIENVLVQLGRTLWDRAVSRDLNQLLAKI